MDTRPQSILLIEDDEDDYVLIRAMLSDTQETRYQLDWAPTFDAGLQALGREEHDAILLDYRLGVRSGFDLLREAIAIGCRAPIIVLTGQGAYSVDVEAMEAGAADYLDKAHLSAPLLERSIRYAVEHRRQEEMLRESEERYRSLVEASASLIALSDLQGKGLFVNAPGAKLLGYDHPAELVGQNLIDSIAPDDRERVIQDFEQTLEQGFMRNTEYTVLTKDGRALPVVASAAVIRDAQLKPQAVVVIMTDLTESKHLAAQFLQAQKMEVVGQLAGGVAHDFNNMLTVIQGYAQFALEELAPADPVRGHLGQVLRAAERSATLTRQLLAFSRRQALQTKVITINELVLEMDKMLRRLIGANIELATIAQDDLWAVRADAGMIEQVLANMAVNARDAMPSGGVLTLETANVTLDESYAQRHLGVRPGEYVMLTVSDNGTGMPPEVQAHLFEPFFTTKPVGKGTGLGLATAYGIIKQHGGHIWVYSEVDQGTTFKIYLPRTKEVEAAHLQEPEDGPLPNGCETVLVAEDESSVRSLTVRALCDLGYTVLEATNGEHALRVVSAHNGPVDLLVTDIVMPQMGGIELASRLAKESPHTKVLYVSGYTAESSARGGEVSRDAAYLAKPYTVADLGYKVREILDQ
jgi:PAS domain S-box-containing protein